MSTRRKRPPADQSDFVMLTWLFTWLLIAAAIAGLVGVVTR